MTLDLKRISYKLSATIDNYTGNIILKYWIAEKKSPCSSSHITRTAIRGSGSENSRISLLLRLAYYTVALKQMRDWLSHDLANISVKKEIHF